MIWDALVIGGGPAGSTTACLLARAGWSVALVEKSGFPRRKVCGEFVSATNGPLLDSLGLGAVFRDAAGPEIRRIGVFARDDAVTADMPVPPGAAFPWGRALGREKLDALLLERARSAGARLWQPYAAVALSAERDHHICTIRARDGERQLRARVVVAAHGSWEPGRLPSHAPTPHRESDLLAFKAHFRDCGLAPDLMPLLAFPGGYGGIVHSDTGRSTLSLCMRRDAVRRAREAFPGRSASHAVLEHVLRHCRAVSIVLNRARLEDRWLSAGPIAPGIRAGYARDVFRVGNAAGEAHPIIAEGIGMALQSADLLVRHLSAGRHDVSTAEGRRRVGKAYQADWRRRFTPRIRAAALFAALAMRDRSAEWLLPLLQRCPRILTVAARQSGKIAVPATGIECAKGG